jgi:hypothetical protein
MKHGFLLWSKDTNLHSFIHQWLYSPLLGSGLFFSFVISFSQPVGLLGRVISPSQGRYLHAGQHKHRIRTHDPSVRGARDHCDRHPAAISNGIPTVRSMSSPIQIWCAKSVSKRKYHTKTIRIQNNDIGYYPYLMPILMKYANASMEKIVTGL